MKYENSCIVEWGDKPTLTGRFKGAGYLDQALNAMFDGGNNAEGYPFKADIMGKISFGTKCKVTITIETLPDETKNSVKPILFPPPKKKCRFDLTVNCVNGGCSPFCIEYHKHLMGRRYL